MTADEAREITRKSIEARENTIDEKQLSDIYKLIDENANNCCHCAYYEGITPGNKNALIKNGFIVNDDEISWLVKSNHTS